MDFYPGFRRQTIETRGTTINVVSGGNGPPLLLLHGYPQTHIEWRKIAPELAKHFTLVMPDLRGYGDSGKPPAGDNHVNYAKRAMALDQVEVMGKLGYDKFFVAGHDRGARTAHRMALDHPDRVLRAACVDILPSRHIWTHASKQWAMSSWHWLFMAQPYDFPERMMSSVLST